MSVHDLKTHKSTHAHVYILPAGQYWADIWFCGSLTTLVVKVFTETACLHYCRAHASPVKEHCLEVFFQCITGKLQVIYAKCIHGHVTSLWKCHHFNSKIEIWQVWQKWGKKQVQCKLLSDWQGDCHMCSGQTKTKLHTKPPSQAMQWSWGGLKTKSITRTSVREEEREG